MGEMSLDPNFQFGRTTRMGACCNKPVGCTMRPEGCLFKMHPWKRAVIDKDPTVRCQASSPITGQCTLMNLHEGDHQPEKPGGNHGD